MAFDVGAVVATLTLNTAQAEDKARQSATKMQQELGAKMQQTSRTTSAAIQDIGKSTSSLGPIMGQAMTRWLGPIALVTAAIYGMKRAMDETVSVFQRGIRAIDEMNMTAAQMAASIQTSYPTAPFEEALQAARQLIPLIERMDASYSGSGQDLVQLANAMLRYGAAADVMKVITDETGKQKQAFVALAEAIKAQTGGQNLTLQLQQEIRALMSGTNVAGAALLRILESQNKELGEMVPKWAAQGTLLENLAPYLQGYVKASKEVSETISAQQATWQTIVDRILRTAVLPAYTDIVDLQKAANKALFDQQGNLTDIGKVLTTVIQTAWEAVRIVARGIWDVIRAYKPEMSSWSDMVTAVSRKFLTILNILVEIVTKFHNLMAMGRHFTSGVLAVAMGDWNKALSHFSAIKTNYVEAIHLSSRFRQEQEKIAQVGAKSAAASANFKWPYTPRPGGEDAEKAKKAAKASGDAMLEASKNAIELTKTQLELAKAEGDTARAAALQATLIDMLTRVYDRWRESTNQARLELALSSKQMLDSLKTDTVSFEAIAKLQFEADAAAESLSVYLENEQKIMGAWKKLGGYVKDTLSSAWAAITAPATETRLTRLEQQIAELNEEIAALPPGSQAAAIALKELAEVEKQLAEGKAAAGAAPRQYAQEWIEAARSIKDALGNAFYDMISGAKSFVDAMRGFFQDILQAFSAMVAEMLAKWIFNKTIGAWFPELATAAVPAMAAGGIVTKPTLALVGESGPEAVIPLARGGNSQLALAGAGGPNINITIQAIDTQTGLDFLMKNRGAVATALQQAIGENAPVGRRR